MSFISEKIKKIPGSMIREMFAMRLLKEKHVVVVPGTGFGDGGEGFVRLAYATSEDNIREGLRRMKEFVESL